MAPGNIQRLGFSILATGEEEKTKPVVNIVFVHGLHGHPKRTWSQAKTQKPPTNGEEARLRSSLLFKWRSRERSKSPGGAETQPEAPSDVTYWPQDLLPQKISNARILTYGYDVDFTGGLFRGKSKNNITQHARDLMLQLEREVHGEPIIFVAHSLGGILVKEGLYWSKTHLIPKYQALHQCTKHLVFLGVPHRGSKMASMGQIMTYVANAALLDANKQILSSLAVDEELLDRIHSEFMKMLYKQDFSVYTFQEGRGLTGIKGFSGKVVNDSSSKLDYPLEVVETIDGNHMQMVRFCDAEDPGYRKVSSVIAASVTNVEEQDKKPPSASPAVRKTILTPCPVPVEIPSPALLKEKRYFRIPHISNKHFVGRVKELEWLRSHLEESATEEEQRRLVIWGCGGAGKTQLVSTFALRCRAKYSAVFWVTASSEAKLRETYAEIARHLGLAVKWESDQKAAINCVRDWFTDHEQGDWLLIFDNADDLAGVPLAGYIPPTDKGNVIITSRDRQAEAFGPALELGEMDVGDAIALLLRKAGIVQPTMVDETTANEVTMSLGYLALAVEHAGAYVQSVGGSLSAYRSQFETNRRSALENSPKISMHQQSVFDTFDISFNTIKDRYMPAARLLSFFGFLDADAILESSLLRTHENITAFEVKVVTGLQAYHKAIQELLSFSLIRVKIEGTEKIISLHPLVHYFSRARLNLENQWVWKRTSAVWLCQCAGATASDEAFFPHLREQMREAETFRAPPADLQKRRQVYACLGVLQHEYRYKWQNQGAMDELYKYSKIVLDVLEEDVEDREQFHVLATLVATNVQLLTLQFVDSREPFDVVLRRYVTKQMKPQALAALGKARKIDEANKLSGTEPCVEVTEKLLQSAVEVKGDDTALNTALAVMAITEEMKIEPLPIEKTTQEDNHEAEPIRNRGEDIKNPDPPKSEPKSPTENRSSNNPDKKPSENPDNGFSETPIPLVQAKSNEELPGCPELKPTKDPDNDIEDSPFKPQYLSDVFISVTPPRYVTCLIDTISNLIRVYVNHKRTAEAELLLSYSTLPIDPSSQEPAPRPMEVQQLLITVSRYVAENNVQGMLDTCRKIIELDDHGILSYYAGEDYAIIMNKLGKPKEAEWALRKSFFWNPDRTDRQMAMELKDGYVWAKKTLAVCQSMQGQLDESLQTLLSTLETATTCFGFNSLPSLHIAFLLSMFYSQETPLHSQSTADKYAHDVEEILFHLYGGESGKSPSCHKEGYQMGMILWSQGAHPETIAVLNAYARLASREVGGDEQLARKARKASRLAKEEWDAEQAAGVKADVLGCGTIVFPRKMEDLAALVGDGND